MFQISPTLEKILECFDKNIRKDDDNGLSLSQKINIVKIARMTMIGNHRSSSKKSTSWNYPSQLACFCDGLRLNSSQKSTRLNYQCQLGWFCDRFRWSSSQKESAWLITHVNLFVFVMGSTGVHQKNPCDEFSQVNLPVFFRWATCMEFISQKNVMGETLMSNLWYGHHKTESIKRWKHHRKGLSRMMWYRDEPGWTSSLKALCQHAVSMANAFAWTSVKEQRWNRCFYD